jgi:hypothetical protein
VHVDPEEDEISKDLFIRARPELAFMLKMARQANVWDDDDDDDDDHDDASFGGDAYPSLAGRPIGIIEYASKHGRLDVEVDGSGGLTKVEAEHLIALQRICQVKCFEVAFEVIDRIFHRSGGRAAFTVLLGRSQQGGIAARGKLIKLSEELLLGGDMRPCLCLQPWADSETIAELCAAANTILNDRRAEPETHGNIFNALQSFCQSPEHAEAVWRLVGGACRTVQAEGRLAEH